MYLQSYFWLFVFRLIMEYQLHPHHKHNLHFLKHMQPKALPQQMQVQPIYMICKQTFPQKKPLVENFYVATCQSMVQIIPKGPA